MDKIQIFMDPEPYMFQIYSVILTALQIQVYFVVVFFNFFFKWHFTLKLVLVATEIKIFSRFSENEGPFF